MAEQISKHCWSTPKCGISTAEKWFIDIDKPIDYKFIIVRNPYHRMVSFYINKVIYQGTPPWEIARKDFEQEVSIPHLRLGNTGATFEEFLKLVNQIDVGRAERHLQPQYLGVAHMTFDKIVKCESYEEDIREVCGVLDLDYELLSKKNENHFERTPLSLLPPATFKAYKQPTRWFRKFGIPADYSWFYNDELEEIVWNKYTGDFKPFGYERGEI
jgi:hypothetical protein